MALRDEQLILVDVLECDSANDKAMDHEARDEKMRALYRLFTDQLIETLRARGAP